MYKWITMLPAYLNKAHANGTHLGKLIDSLKPVVDRLSKQLCKFLVVEDLKAASAGDFADSCGMETMVIVAVSALDEDAGVTETLGIHFTPNIIQMDT